MNVYGPESKALFLAEQSQSELHDHIRISANDFSNLQFTGWNWEDVEFSQCHLNQTNFEAGKALGFRVEQSNLKEANFRRVSFKQLHFESCMLLKACLGEGCYREIRLKNCMAHSINLDSVKIFQGFFEHLELNRAKMSSAIIFEGNFFFAKERGLYGFQNSTVKNSLFFNCFFEGNVFEQTDLSGSVFLYCRFKDLEWEGNNLTGVRQAGCSGVMPVLHPASGISGALDVNRLKQLEERFLALNGVVRNE